MYSRTVLFCLTVTCVFLQGSADPASTAQSNAASKLVRELAKTYIPSVNPGSIKIVMGLAYVCASYDKSSDVLTSRVYERYAWVDSRLVWNPTDYNGLERIRVPSEKIWTPDITLFNAIDESEDRDETHVIVLPNGTVYWFPPATYKTYCTPTDKKGYNSCQIRLGSWAYPADQIALEIFLSGFDTDFYLEACPYAVSNSSVNIVNRYYPDYPECGADAYPTFDVSFDVHLRKSSERHAEVLRPGRAAVKKEVRKQRRCDWPNTCD